MFATPRQPRRRVGEPYGHWTFALHTLPVLAGTHSL